MWIVRFKTHVGWRYLDRHGRPTVKLDDVRKFTGKGHAKTSAAYYLPVGSRIVVEHRPLGPADLIEECIVC